MSATFHFAISNGLKVIDERKHRPLPSQNRPLTFMTSPIFLFFIFYLYNTLHILSPLKFRISAFQNALKVSIINQIWFCTVNSNRTLEGLPTYLGTDQLEMVVLFQRVFIPTSLPADWSMLNVIFSYDVTIN